MVVIANIFQPLIDVFEAVLKFFHNSIGVPWGWSIVLLTVVIRALLIPLTLKHFHSMQALQRHQPELKALQAKYKDDKQRQQQEMMKFYKENKVNPLGSCLPLVAQLPVFISLFFMLRENLRHDICPSINPIAHAPHQLPCGTHGGAGFLFIPDVTNKATGAVLIALIVLYVGSQVGSSLLMSTPTMDKNQRRLMLLMPLAFVFFFIQYAAGLLVYWITTNLWTILQQYIVKRRIGPIIPPVALPAGAGAAGGASPGGGGGSEASGGARKPAPGGGAKKAAPRATGSGATRKPARSGGGPGGTRKTAAPSSGAASGVGESRREANGAGAAGGLAGLLRGKLKPTPETAPTSAGAGGRAVAPPPPPRKKKKRSGRRR
jgi:YidC/Oxa1 family membrane protein insertase